MPEPAAGPGDVQRSDSEIKQTVQEFYDSVGWKEIGEGLYQNARYEDLRPVSQEYIHRCHLRVAGFLPAEGRYILDAGSGPIQYPEYLEYSRGFEYRVCLDISSLALKEARKRLGERGLYVVGDIAHLPFKDGGFDALVSLHAVHHLPLSEHKQAFKEFLRILAPGGQAAIVSSWGQASRLMAWFRKPIQWAGSAIRLYRRIRRKDRADYLGDHTLTPAGEALVKRAGTFTEKHDYAWVKQELLDWPDIDIRVWRSVSNPFLRAFIHRRLGGRLMLRLLFMLEELAPHFFGRIGQYPMILFRQRPAERASSTRSAPA